MRKILSLIVLVLTFSVNAAESKILFQEEFPDSQTSIHEFENWKTTHSKYSSGKYNAIGCKKDLLLKVTGSKHGNFWTKTNINFDSDKFKDNQSELMDFDFLWSHGKQGYTGAYSAMEIISNNNSILKIEYNYKGQLIVNSKIINKKYRKFSRLSHRIRLDFKNQKYSFWRGKKLVVAGSFTKPTASSQVTGISFAAGMNFAKKFKQWEIQISNLIVTASGNELNDKQNICFNPDLKIDSSKIGLYFAATKLRIFDNKAFAWEKLPEDLIQKKFIRLPLNYAGSLNISAKQTGWLYAFLWVWDYGFLNHLPKNTSLNGWEPVIGKSASFDKELPALNLYRRPLLKGLNKIKICDFFGQWLLTEFKSAEITNQASANYAAISGGKTRYNIFNPGAKIIIQTSDSDYRLFRNKKSVKTKILEQTDKQITMRAPNKPGRYVLKISNSVLPITISYPPGNKALNTNFFPVQMWNGWGCETRYNLNPKYFNDLSVLFKFEQGCNTFFLNCGKDFFRRRKSKSLQENLNCALIVTIRQILKYPLNMHSKSPQKSQNTYSWIIKSLKGAIDSKHISGDNIFGVYVADEPREKELEGLKKFKDAYLKFQLPYYLLFCTLGQKNKSWQTLSPKFRVGRIYPIRRKYKIREEWVKHYISALDNWQNEYSTPLMFTAQTFGDYNNPKKLHLWHYPSSAEVKLMLNLALARGVKGLSYFCQETNRNSREGLKCIVKYPYVTEKMFQGFKTFSEFLKKIAQLLPHLKWNKKSQTTFEKFDIQYLTDKRTKDKYIFICNTDVNNSHTYKLQLIKGLRSQFSCGDNKVKITGDYVEVTLGPGNAIVLTTNQNVDVK